ncbi:MAG: ABC transporter ATP-binding protein [Halobacteriota archaeon]
MDEVIRLDDVTKIYDGGTKVLDKVSLSLKDEWTTIIGPSGSGKTTLLNIIGCLDIPTSGAVRVAGQLVTGSDKAALTKLRREHIGLIFQQYHLVPYLTAVENVMLAQYYYDHGVTDEAQAENALKNVGLGHRLDHLPAHLSGGEQQRVCIARALINEPTILLADEPTGNLDQTNGHAVLELIQNLREAGHAIVLVTHNQDIVELGDRTIHIVDGKVAWDSELEGGNHDGKSG